MGLKKRWAAVVVIALMMVGAMQAATIRPSVANGQAGGENSDAPYIYYFSGRAHAWVIERADGTDRRLFGYGVIPLELNAADQVQWSPSGRWLSWLGYENCALYGSYQSCSRNYQWQVLNTASQIPLTTFAGRMVHNLDLSPFSVGTPLHWSPTEDLLLVHEDSQYPEESDIYDEFADPMVSVRFSLLDAANNEELWKFERYFPNPAHQFSSAWLNDGQTVVFHYVVADGSGNQHSFVVMGRDGQPIERTIIADWLSILPSGKAVYQQRSELWLTDLRTGQIQRIALSHLRGLSLAFGWNSDGTAAYVFVKEHGDFVAAWWLDIMTNTLIPITDAPTEIGTSPDSRYLYFVENQTAYFFDSETQKITLLFPLPDGASASWMSNNLLFVAGESYLGVIENSSLINLQTGEIKPISTALPAHGPCDETARLSANGRYWAWIDGSPHVYDMQTGQQITLASDSRGFMSVPGIGVRWHPQAAWFLTFDAGLIAGGGCGPIYHGVASADGSVRRDIYSDHVDWLPDRIDPEIFPLDTAPPSPKPVMTLEGTAYSMILDWSPDGKYLVADNNHQWRADNPQAMNLWEVSSGKLIAQVGNYNQDYAFSDSIREFEWEYLPSGVYVPTELKETPPIPLPGWMSPKIRAISPDGKFWLLQSRRGKFYIFNRNLFQVEIKLPDDYYLINGEFSPDGRLFASNSYFLNALRIYDTETWNILFEAEIAALALDFSPDGEYLAVGVSWDVEIWRVSDLIGAGIQEN